MSVRPQKWQIQQMFFRAGAHLAKREKWSYARPMVNVGFKPETTDYPFRGRSIWQMNLTRVENPHGNLDNELYRLFIGEPDLVRSFAQCRVCLSIELDKFERSKHGKKGCNILLSEALKLAKAERKCLVCGIETGLTTWGAPLCGENCRALWRFDVCQPAALRRFLLSTQARPNYAKIL